MRARDDKQEQNRLGEANVLVGLGRLEAKSNPELSRGYFQRAAQLYETLGLEDWKEIALREISELGG